MHATVHALSITGSMTWQITWALILGFALSSGYNEVWDQARGEALTPAQYWSPSGCRYV
jgi:hypothetical protein